MDMIKHPGVRDKFNAYPAHMRKKLMFLRQLIFETAAEIELADGIEETLKWGEPSYIAKRGSTIRIGWKESSPDQYAMYFICNTRLVDTFRELYRDVFALEGNRAIIFQENDPVPEEELKHCILLSLTYHSRKNKPLLGV